MRHVMLRMTKWMLSGGLVMLLGMTAYSDAAWAQPPDGGGLRGGRMGRRMDRPPGGPLIHLRRLGLSEAQRGQIRSIYEQSRETNEGSEKQVRVVRLALREAVTADVVDEGAIRALATELGVAEGDAAVQRAYVHVRVWQVLTPEQRAAAREAKVEMQQRMERRRQRMGERRKQRQQRRQ